MQAHLFSRRTFLRGVGVSMALPWMESLRVWGDETKSSATSSAADDWVTFFNIRRAYQVMLYFSAPCGAQPRVMAIRLSWRARPAATSALCRAASLL